MPITIKANVAGPTLLGAYASGKAKGEARRMEQAMAQMEANKRLAINRKYQLDDLATERKENDFNFNRKGAMAPMPEGVAGNLRAASAYGKLQAEEQKIYSGLEVDPRSPEAQDRLRQIAEDKRMLEEVNPNPTPGEAYDRSTVIIGPDGKTTGPDGKPYTTVPPGGRVGHLDENGRELPPVKDPTAEAQKAEQEKKQAEELKRQQEALDEQYDEQVARWEDERDAAKADRDAQIKELNDKDPPPADKADQIARIREDYRDKWTKKPRRPTARLPELPPVPGAPTGGGMPIPGAPPAAPMPGAPAPAAPGAPAPDPGIVGPDGTPIVAPPAVAGGAPKTAAEDIATNPYIDDGMIHYDKDGRQVDKFGKPVQWKINDGVQYVDKDGNPLDEWGYPIRYVQDKDGNFKAERIGDKPTGKDSSRLIDPPRRTDTMPNPAAPGGGPPAPSAPAAPAPPAAVPGAAAPAPAVPDTVTPKQVSDELNALMDQMKEAGKTINDLSDADRAYIDELVRRLKGA